MSEKYRIGTIAKCVGLKGELAVNPDTFDTNRFFDLESVFVGRTDTMADLLSIESVRMHKSRPILKFASVHSRNDAERLTGMILFVDEKDSIELPEGQFFIHDIIGMSVYTVDETFVGKVHDVLPLPAHNVYLISDGEKEMMIPAVDEFIQSIDGKNKIIRIKPIEGLLE
jgi:16S rRNA processing protein RimM